MTHSNTTMVNIPWKDGSTRSVPENSIVLVNITNNFNTTQQRAVFAIADGFTYTKNSPSTIEINEWTDKTNVSAILTEGAEPPSPLATEPGSIIVASFKTADGSMANSIWAKLQENKMWKMKNRTLTDTEMRYHLDHISVSISLKYTVYTPSHQIEL